MISPQMEVNFLVISTQCSQLIQQYSTKLTMVICHIEVALYRRVDRLMLNQYCLIGGFELTSSVDGGVMGQNYPCGTRLPLFRKIAYLVFFSSFLFEYLNAKF